MTAEVTRESLPNILLVDDEEVLRERLATAIRSRGYEVRTAGSSDEALREVAKDSPEMAVLDLRMPGGSGLELLRELKRQDPATRVLKDGAPFMTLMPGMFDYELRLRAMDQAGVDIAIVTLTSPNVFWGSAAQSLEAVRLMNDNAFGLTAAIWTMDEDAAIAIGDRVATGTWFMNRCDYLDPALAWAGVKNSGRGCSLSRVGYDQLTRPKSFHLRTAL